MDEPGPAVDAAEVLISTVMRDRGYPVDDFDEQADLVAADHPEMMNHYREAHAAHERHRSSGGIDTEDLRQSFVHYRALFVVLVQDNDRPVDAATVTTTNDSDATADAGSTSAGPNDAGPTNDAERTNDAEPTPDPERNGVPSTHPQETR